MITIDQLIQQAAIYPKITNNYAKYTLNGIKIYYSDIILEVLESIIYGHQLELNNRFHVDDYKLMNNNTVIYKDVRDHMDEIEHMYNMTKLYSMCPLLHDWYVNNIPHNPNKWIKSVNYHITNRNMMLVDNMFSIYFNSQTISLEQFDKHIDMVKNKCDNSKKICAISLTPNIELIDKRIFIDDLNGDSFISHELGDDYESFVEVFRNALDKYKLFESFEGSVEKKYNEYLNYLVLPCITTKSFHSTSCR